MKKMAAFLMAFTLVCTSSPADLHTGAATETVYTAQAVAISSEEDLVAMQGESGWKLLSGERYHD